MPDTAKTIAEIEYHQNKVMSLTDRLKQEREEELRQIRLQAKSRRLSRRETASLIGITREYTYKLNIPFTGRKIDALKLKDWVKLHMPDRYEQFSKRLERILR